MSMSWITKVVRGIRIGFVALSSLNTEKAQSIDGSRDGKPFSSGSAALVLYLELLDEREIDRDDLLMVF